MVTEASSSSQEHGKTRDFGSHKKHISFIRILSKEFTVFHMTQEFLSECKECLRKKNSGESLTCLVHMACTVSSALVSASF